MSPLFFVPDPLNFSQMPPIGRSSVPFSVPFGPSAALPPLRSPAASGLFCRLQQFLNAIIATLRVKFTV